MSHTDRSSNLRVRGELRPPRTWAAMLDAWGALLGTLCSFLPAPDADAGRWIREKGHPLHLAAWRWMWSLPPCSEARKAAFTLGEAAMLVDRWRLVSVAPLDVIGEEMVTGRLAIGQRAESLLRIAVWHIDDARGEAHGRTLGIEPTVPPHERVYVTDAIAHERYGGMWCSGDSGVRLARAMIADHVGFNERAGARVPGAELKHNISSEGPFYLEGRFAETVIASLPDGPWVMTSRDVERFLDLILEERRPTEFGAPLQVREIKGPRQGAIIAIGSEEPNEPPEDMVPQREPWGPAR